MKDKQHGTSILKFPGDALEMPISDGVVDRFSFCVLFIFHGLEANG